ncbi:class I SAM-dependent methyltransferase [Crenobacter cavernae]|uniref:Class I SAM-dependent methyltransferase n=1 Tax=Crenobacter cavernae TaxID=2290923 RepID=A0ABY0FB56_9NEIS|nr:SAM-dependent methyltransferase [Crenobacter cavernae]RXZ43122.1 class I SAM-dependent methyltransferase [Crenobacter cavernae]
MTTLPAPAPEALAVSTTLAQKIADEIAAAGGWIPFSHYMECALYAPGLGYYAAGSRKFGEAGDFVTAPELSPFFAACLARQLAELLPQTNGVIYEFGAGTGRLAADLLAELKALGVTPTAYRIVDLSPDLIERQRETLAEHLSKVEWLTELPAEIDGVVIGNEVLDAMPCELVHWTGTGALQRGVVVENGAFAFDDRPITDKRLAELAERYDPRLPGYVSEISLANRGFVRELAARLARGAIVLIDYGFSEREYYLPERRMGTLIGHYRHHTVHDPFYLPGLMDLTSHVDFTAVAETGIEAGLDLIGYLNQAQFLVNCGLSELLTRLDVTDTVPYAKAVSAVQKLMSPAEMGELFKVIAFGRGVSIDWLGFIDGDRCHTL